MMGAKFMIHRGLILGLIGAVWTARILASEAMPPPRPELIQLANLIVHAEVDHITPSRPKSDGMATARFRVIETVRGAADVGSMVEVSYRDNLLCPEPPTFRVADKRILLLSATDADGKRRFIWGRHAVRSGSIDELKEIKTELRAVCPFLLETDPAKRKSKQIDWVFERLSAKRRWDQSSVIGNLAAWSEPDYAVRYAQKRTLAANGDPAARRWIDNADLPLDLATDLYPARKFALRHAIEHMNEYDKRQPMVAAVLQRVESSPPSAK